MRTTKIKEIKKEIEIYGELDIRKTAIYVRESSKTQADEGYNIHAQKDKCKEYVKVFLSESVEDKFFYAEKGYSAKTIDRPVMNKLIQDIKNGKIKTVVVQKIDRIARRNKGMYELLELFETYDIRFISIRENIDTNNKMWKMILSFYIMLAEIEQDQISERTGESFQYGASIGSYIKGNVAPFGTYKEKVYNDDGSHKIILKRHPWQWAILETIYSLAYNGANCTQISLRINSLPVMQSHNKKIGENQIHRILSNKIYMGVMTLQGKEYRIDFENCMDAEYWNQVQINRAIHLKRNPHNDYAYHGKIMCDCNTPCIVDVTNKRKPDGSIKKYKYYVCPCCGKRISETKLLEMIEPKIKHRYDVEVMESFKEKQEQKIYRIKNLNDDLHSMYLNGDVDRSIYIEQLKKSNEDIERIEARMNTKRKKYEKLQVEERAEYINQFISCIKVNMITKDIKIQLLC